MYDEEPTIRTVEIGEAIRQRLDALGVTGVDVATHLGWAPSKVSRLLVGKRPVSDHDLAKVIGYCGVKHDFSDYLLRLAAERHRTCPFIMPAHQPTVVNYAAEAVDTVAFCRDGLPLELIDLNHALWQQDRRNRHSTYYLAEHLLHDRGDGADHGARLHTLLQLSMRTYLSVRCYLPESLSARTRDIESFTLFRFYEMKPVVQLHTLTNTIYIGAIPDVAAYRQVLGDVNATALSEDDTRALILHRAANSASALTDDTPIPIVAPRRLGSGSGTKP